MNTFRPHRVQDQNARITHIEEDLAKFSTFLEALSRKVASSSGDPTGGGLTAVVQSSGGGGGGGGGGISTLSGDVTGPATQTVVERIRETDIPAPVAGDDEKFVKYQHATPAFEYSHIDRIQNVPIAAPVAGDDQKFVQYDHAGPSFVYTAVTVQTISVTTETMDYVVPETDVAFQVVLVDATGGMVTVTLPDPAAMAEKAVVVKKIDGSANTVVVDGDGADVDGAADYTISVQYESISVVSDGTDWWIF